MTSLGVARSFRCNGPFCTTVRFVGEDTFVFQTFGVVSFYRFPNRISTALTRRRVPHSSTWSTALTRRRAPHSSRWICFASTCKQSIAGKSWPQVMPAILNCDVVSPLGRVTLSGCVFAEYHVQHPEASLHVLASNGYSSFGVAAGSFRTVGLQSLARTIDAQALIFVPAFCMGPYFSSLGLASHGCSPRWYCY